MSIGKLFDIPIQIHWSWSIGFVLITMFIAFRRIAFHQRQTDRDTGVGGRRCCNDVPFSVGIGARVGAFS